MDTVHIIALSMGSAWASGINLYAAVFVLGFMNSAGYITLPPELQVLSSPLVMIIAAIMYCVEFFADKTPGVDTGWDVLQTFIRIPAGAVLAAHAVGDVSPGAELAAYLAGGAIAAGTHLTKASARVMINTSPEPFSNWGASIAEDVAVIGGLWTALYHPWVFLTLFVTFGLLVAWLLPKLWRALRRLYSTIGRWLAGGRSETQTDQRGDRTPGQSAEALLPDGPPRVEKDSGPT
jgi:hypothetical protein